MAEKEQDATVVEDATPDEVNLYEQQARKGGWVPQEEWKGDPEQWVDYREFNFRGELMSRINEQSSIIDHLKRKDEEKDLALHDLKNLQDKISEREFNKALKFLKQQKVDAIEAGDGEKVVEIDEEIQDLKEAKQTTTEPPKSPEGDAGIPPELTAWLADPKNSWYATDKVLKRQADGIAEEILKLDPNTPPATLLTKMEKQLREEMPEKFRSRPTSVDDGGGDGATRVGRNGKKPTFNDLDEDQKACAKRFEKMGLMTIKEYIDEQVALGEL